MSTTDKSPEEKQLIALQEYKVVYDAFRDYMKIEHNLQNERSTWHHVIQGLLFTTLGVLGQWNAGQPDLFRTEKRFLPYILAISGIAIAKAAYDSMLQTLPSKLSVRGGPKRLRTIPRRSSEPSPRYQAAGVKRPRERGDGKFISSRSSSGWLGFPSW